MLINITLTGDKELIARLSSMPRAVLMALKLKVTELALLLEAYVKMNKLNGQVLRRISGRLSSSIHNVVTETGNSVIGMVFQSGDVPYGAIHEYGGKTMPHVIEPKKAHALAFGGKFYARVNHPGSKMPERSYLRSSLHDMSVKISTEMKTAVVQAAQKAVDG